MANAEMQAKGKRKKGLSLVIPEGFEEVVGDIGSLPDEVFDQHDREASPSVATHGESPSYSKLAVWRSERLF